LDDTRQERQIKMKYGPDGHPTKEKFAAKLHNCLAWVQWLIEALLLLELKSDISP